MGPSALRVCFGLTFLLALCNADRTRSVIEPEQKVRLLPADFCPCLTRADCPRVFGTLPEDALLGTLPPCKDRNLVRCCGVSTSVSVSSSDSEIPEQKRRRPDKQEDDDVPTKLAPVVPPGIFIPVPFVFPEYVDYRTSTVPPSYLSFDDESESEEDLLSVRGTEKEESSSRQLFTQQSFKSATEDKNIDDAVSQMDAFTSRDYLDYHRGVDEHDFKEGESQTTSVNEQRGESQSRKRIVEGSLSSDDKISQRIVTHEDATSTDVQKENEEEEESLPEDNPIKLPITAAPRRVEPDHLHPEFIEMDSRGERKNEADLLVTYSQNSANAAPTIAQPVQLQRYESRSPVRGKTVFGNRQNTWTQSRESEKVTRESSNVEENRSSTVTVSGVQLRDGGTRARIAARRRRPQTIPESQKATNSRGRTVYGGRNEVVTHQQQISESVSKESKNMENEHSSNVESVSLTTDRQEDIGTSAQIVGRRRGRPTANRESLSRGENRYIVLGSRGRAEKTSSQRNSETVKMESSKVEENTSSNVQTITTNAEQLSDGDARAALITAGRRPILESEEAISSRRPFVESRGKLLRGRVKEISTRVQSASETVKEESSNVEESTSSDVRSIATKTGDLSAQNAGSVIFSTSRLPVPEAGKATSYVRTAIGSRGKTIRAQNKETSTRQQSETVKKETSNVEQSTSSNVQNNAAGIENLQCVNGQSELVDCEILYGQKKVSFDEQRIESSEKKSSSFENNTSSKSVVSTASIEELRNDNAGSEVTHEKEETITLANRSQKSEAKTETSSRVEENVFSNVERAVIGNEARTDVGSNRKLTEAETDLQTTSNTKTKSSNSVKNEESVSSQTSKTETNSFTSNRANLFAESISSGSRADYKSGRNENTDLHSRSKIGESLSRTEEMSNNGVRHSAHRVYIPVLINAGFLKDRPISTGPVGLDPLSGVAHSDVTNPGLASELLPLSCGNVVFGERSKNRRTLVCEISGDNKASIRLFTDDSAVPLSPEKLDGSALPGAVVIDKALHLKKIEESMKSATLNVNKNGSRTSTKQKILLKRPTEVPTVEEHKEKEMIAIPKSTQIMNRGKLRHGGVRQDFESQRDSHIIRGVEQARARARETGSRQSARNSISTSSSSRKTTSAQESVSTSSSTQETTKSKVDVSSAEKFDARRKAEALNSKFYLLPLASILPPPAEITQEIVEPEVMEVIQEAPVARTRVGNKIPRTASSTKDLPSSELKVLNINSWINDRTLEKENEFVSPDNEEAREPTFFYNRSSRQVKRSAPVQRPVWKRETIRISPEDLSKSGRISVVGTIPKGYKDPAIYNEEVPGIEIPTKSTANFN